MLQDSKNCIVHFPAIIDLPTDVEFCSNLSDCIPNSRGQYLGNNLLLVLSYRLTSGTGKLFCFVNLEKRQRRVRFVVHIDGNSNSITAMDTVLPRYDFEE